MGHLTFPITTLLHVPALPTSWFGTQRWLYLDTSWKFLLVGIGAG